MLYNFFIQLKINYMKSWLKLYYIIINVNVFSYSILNFISFDYG